MKPNFALNFTDDSIALLHRTKRGWTEIGSTPFDVDDLPGALAALRDKALALAPDGITTKLVIPNSQIKYLTIDAPGPDAAKRRAQIAAGLEGQTPYDVADLVWDHWGKGPAVQVAVLARETLDEAEGFAVANGFNPISFVAIPDDAGYAAEPFFGPSAFSTTLLKDGAKVDRDQDPIRLLAPEADQTPQPGPDRETDPKPPVEPEPLPDLPEPEPEPEPAPAPQPNSTPQELPAPADEPMRTPPPEEIPADQPAEQPADLPGYDSSPEPLSAALDAASRPEPSLSEATLDPRAIADTLNAEDPPAAAAPPARSGSVVDSTIPDADEAPMALDVDDTSDQPGTRPADVAPAGDDDLPPPLPGAALAAFSGRKQTTDSARPAAPRPAGLTAERPVALAKGDRPAAAPRPAPKFGYETPGAKPATPKPVGSGAKALRGLGALVTSPTIPGGKKARVSIQTAASAGTTPAAPTDGTQTAARRPVGLGSRPMPVRGKPRHLGLILTGLLLIMLALAAGLSTFYVSQSDTVAPVDTAATDADLPAAEDEMAADLAEAAPLADPQPPSAPVEAASADGVVMQATDPNSAPASIVANPAPQDVATTEPSTAPSTGAGPQDEIFLAAADTAPKTVDAAALPLPAARADPAPQPSPTPPPFGTVYQFDENGLIRPTPEGIITPEGVLLTAGRPARLPPPRPESIAAAAAAAAPAPTVSAPTQPQTEPQVIIPADPALADARPQPRPATLAPLATPQDDGATLAPAADPRLANLRPAARPASFATAFAPAATAPVAASNNGSLALVAPDGQISPTGLMISRRPAARPEDMRRAIEEAVAAVARLPEPNAPPPEPDSPEAEPEPEPEVASAAPRIPSSANVAKQATINNAINLRELNLIGVYGTQSERYALVRNPNGRYVKVSVGDRLDGGRVAAITSSELRYEKRGRMVVLALPNS